MKYEKLTGKKSKIKQPLGIRTVHGFILFKESHRHVADANSQYAGGVALGLGAVEKSPKLSRF